MGMLRGKVISPAMLRRLAFICADHWSADETHQLLVMSFYFATHPCINDTSALLEVLLRGAVNVDDVLRISNLWHWFGMPDSSIVWRASSAALKAMGEDNGDQLLDMVRLNQEKYGPVLRERLNGGDGGGDEVDQTISNSTDGIGAGNKVLLESTVESVLFASSGSDLAVRKSIQQACGGTVPRCSSPHDE